MNGYAGTRDAYLSSYPQLVEFWDGDEFAGGWHCTRSGAVCDLPVGGWAGTEWGDDRVGDVVVVQGELLRLHVPGDPAVAGLARGGGRRGISGAAGQPWSVAGAKGAGSDLAAVADATVVAGWVPQWLTANVTAGVQAMAAGQPNYGWRMVGVSGNGNDKTFWSREYAADPTLRPKLVVTYTSGGTNVPPTVVLTSPVTGTSVVAPASVVVSADASDGDGSVSRVDFYAGATLIGSDSTAPYSVTWSNVGAGSYALTAVAVDNAWGEHDVGGGEPDGDGGGERAADGGADESGDWDECGGAGERGGECGRERR